MSKIVDRHLLFGAAVAQVIMQDKPLYIKERPESQNNLFEFCTSVGHSLVLFKYSTKNRSPWQFTLPRKQMGLLIDCETSVYADKRFTALICGLDGVCLVDLMQLTQLVDVDQAQSGLSVRRPRSGSYRVSGPKRVKIAGAVPRNRWTKEIVGV